MSGDKIDWAKKGAPVTPQFYLHCRLCVAAKMRPDIEAFVDITGKLYVWCRHHDMKIYHTETRVMDVSKMECGKVGPHAH
jgi:hypothetical protein